MDINQICNITPDGFDAAAIEIFRHQAALCRPYAEYIELLGIDPGRVERVADIPYLPIEIFKSRTVYCRPEPAALTFTSSGTTGDQTSSHHVCDPAVYRASFRRGFELFYGPAADYAIFALLPSYMERSGSSLVYMVQDLQGANPSEGGFYLYDHPALEQRLRAAATAGVRILLIGVSFALLDFADYLRASEGGGALFSEQTTPPPIVMETGGMKGRRREIDRGELHRTLGEAFGVAAIESEYGMTELLSQAYSHGDGLFRTPPWMRVAVRDIYNPLRAAATDADGTARGAINIIDLANIDSCSFIATQDRGELLSDGSFRVLGRLENAILRGCNMLIE